MLTPLAVSTTESQTKNGFQHRFIEGQHQAIGIGAGDLCRDQSYQAHALQIAQIGVVVNVAEWLIAKARADIAIPLEYLLGKIRATCRYGLENHEQGI